MSQYQYYQVEGGNEDWKIVPVADVGAVKPHMYRTILSLDNPPTDSTTKEGYAAIKYSGPLYFDLDDATSPGSTAKHLVNLIDKLVGKDVDEDCMEIFASGGKGFHLTLDQEVFIEKPAKGYAFLPAIYKEVAYELAVQSMDFRVYTARRGRMLRVANVLRPNGLYKVQVTAAEVRKIAAMPKDEAEEYYKTLCGTPRTLFEVKKTRAFGLQALFDSCKNKVTAGSKKAAKQKPVELPDNLPSFEAMLRGEGIRSDAGFHPVAMQVAITSHARGMSCEELVEAAEGLILNHVSDGSRYDTPDKRRRELRRMWDYTEDNPCYAYGAGAIRALLSHSAPDLAGVQASEEEIQEGIDNPTEDASEFDHASVILTEAGVSIPVEGGVKKALALGFAEPTELLSASSGKSSVIQSRIKLGSGRDLGVHTLELDMFNSASAFSKAMMPFGQVFLGNDAQARGVYLRLVEKARKGGRRLYVLNREGVDVVKMPFHSEPAVREGVLVFADREAVLRSDQSDQFEDFNLKFVGYPNPLGIFQSDLSLAPRIAELQPEEGELLRQTIWDTLRCQTPGYVGKLIGWTVACHYRMVFHAVYNQFPLLHVTGAAGAGKTSMVKLIANLHYMLQEPKMMTPSSTPFSIKEAAAASASIPLIIDEYKPHEMRNGVHDVYKLMFRDAYNCREVSRGGGTRESSDYRVLQTAQLSAPIAFVAEAAESEPAVMERVVLLTLVKPPSLQEQQFFRHFDAARANRKYLGVLGAFLAKSVVNTYSAQQLKQEFDPIYNQARTELMLQPGDAESLSFDERRQKSSTKERTVYNYAVLRFGLAKFNNLVKWVMSKDTNLERKADVEDILGRMYAEATSTVGELQAQTIPEWMKVFNAFSLMATSDPYLSYYLKEGKHYSVGGGEEPTFEISARECYTRYRLFCAATNDKPLFPSEQAFLHAITHLPCRVDTVGELGPNSHLFDLQTLRLQGFADMPMKGG